MQKRPPSINFVKKKTNFLDQFFKWALSVGRLLVLLTELVALMTFFYRFSLDRQLIDLHTKIKQEQAIVAYLKNQEETYRNLQDKITLADVQANQSANRVKLFADIVGFASEDMSFTTLTVFEDGVRVSIGARNVNDVSEFVDSLRNHPEIQSVSIDKIENKSSTATILANITALFEEKKEVKKGAKK